jgi:dsDNA-specific endonuclease/ATPase MutS2
VAPDDHDDDDWDPEAVVEVPITCELDLHAFLPRDVKDVTREYLDACVERGFREVRLVHGKGVGVQREIVHGVLRAHPAVESFVLADASRGGWGATIVRLRTRP